VSDSAASGAVSQLSRAVALRRPTADHNAPVRASRARLRALGVFHRKFSFYGGFVWVRRALIGPCWCFSARAYQPFLVFFGPGRYLSDVEEGGATAFPPGLLIQGVLGILGVPQDPLAPVENPLGSYPDRESAIGNAPALVPGPSARL
jgi:hypothetical protein